MSQISEIIQIIIFTMTIVLSISLAGLILCQRILRQNKLNWFTINVCLTSAIFCLDMLIVSIQRLSGMENTISCRIQGFIIEMGVSQLMYCHATIATSRVLAIVYASKHFFRSTKFSLFCMGIGWVVAILIALPYFFTDGFTCMDASDKYFLPYYTLIATIIFPMIIVGISNFRILCFVRGSTRQVNIGNRTIRNSHSRDIHLIKVLIGTFLVFSFGWTPTFIVNTFFDTENLPDVVNLLLQMLPSLSIFLDICLLIYANQPVRMLLRQCITRKLFLFHRNKVDLVKQIQNPALIIHPNNNFIK